METLELSECLSMNEDLLDFNLNEEVEDDDKIKASSNDHSRSLPEFAEEELEWLSNKDAFPAVETCLDMLSIPSGLVPNHTSPISVLENCNNINNNTIITNFCSSIQVPVKYPVKPRSKRRRKARIVPELPSPQCWSWDLENEKKQELPSQRLSTADSIIGRRCQHCQAEKTPQWRAGPMGPKTLCNACGVRFKSGRLCTEYRPANSPTFSSVLHSNSHRKIAEMRKHKQPGEMIVNEAREYSVGYRQRMRIGFPKLPSQQCWWWDQQNEKKQELPNQRSSTSAIGKRCHQKNEELPSQRSSTSAIGRRCQHCLAEKTPQWRAGPMGPKTLCNACGVRFKSGRLCAEYRPANSPSFSSVLHSYSHRKIVEMRKHKQPGEMAEMTVNKARGYNIGYRSDCNSGHHLRNLRRLHSRIHDRNLKLAKIMNSFVVSLSSFHPSLWCYRSDDAPAKS